MKLIPSFLRRSKPADMTGEVIRSVTVDPNHAAMIREATASNRKTLRMYEAALTTSMTQDFQPTFGSANAEIVSSLDVVRGRCRTLCKDDPTAKGALRVFKNNVVGDEPFPLDMRVGSWSADGKTFTLETETNRKIKEAWEEAGLPENCTVRQDMTRMELYQCLEASALRDGSVYLRHRRGYPANKFSYAVELVESDRLQTQYQGFYNGNPIRFSIERDFNYNFPVAYWILTRHPGDLFGYQGRPTNLFRDRVPAADIIAFNNLRDRAEQDIGFPEFDSVANPLHRNKQFDIAHVNAAIRAACKAFYITKQIPTGMTYSGDPNSQFGAIGWGGGLPPSTDPKTGGANKLNTIKPGEAELLDWGFEPKMLDPKFPVESATCFKKDNLKTTASGMGLSYAAISADYEGFSFSTARAAQIPERDYFKVRQKNLINTVVRRHFNEWLKYAILSGVLPAEWIGRLEELQKAADFTGKRWPYINPQDDAKTDIMLIEANLKTRGQVLRESEGCQDWEEVITALAEEKKIAEAHDIDLTQDVTNPTLPKGEPGATKAPDAQPIGPGGS
jgi:lambda family phage portal protein